MNEKNSAFPQTYNENGALVTELGFSKREYFAGLAMQSYITALNGENNQVQIVELSISMADIMLATLDR